MVSQITLKRSQSLTRPIEPSQLISCYLSKLTPYALPLAPSLFVFFGLKLGMHSIHLLPQGFGTFYLFCFGVDSYQLGLMRADYEIVRSYAS